MRAKPATQKTHPEVHEGLEEVIDSTNKLRALRVLRGETTCLLSLFSGRKALT
jgi:hypothetical protein